MGDERKKNDKGPGEIKPAYKSPRTKALVKEERGLWSRGEVLKQKGS